jgi:soluble lytic murein transglycosylase-like protein
MRKLILLGLCLAPLKLVPSTGTLEDHYRDAARHFGITFETAYQIGAVESSHRPHVIAKWCKKRDRKRGNCASGVMQLKPVTARHHCGLKKKDLFNPRKNIFCGVLYYTWNLKQAGSKSSALGMYYAGPTGFKRRGGLKDRKIRRYVNKVQSVIAPRPVDNFWLYGW